MSTPSRAKSPSTSSGNSDSVDGRGKSGSLGTKAKGSPAIGKLLKFNKKAKTDMTELTPPTPRADRELSSTADSTHDPSPGPDRQRVPSPENFFSFAATEDVNIWGDDFTAVLKKTTMRKRSLFQEENKFTEPLQEKDSNVQNIGVAYVAADNSSGFVRRDTAEIVRRATSPPQMVSTHPHKLGKSVSVSTIGEMRPRTKTESSILDVNSLSVRRPMSHDTDSSPDRVVLLERQIEELKSARWQAPPVRDTIDRILVGKTYCLEWYKSHAEKRALLDAAIETNDGNCITAVLLFIRKTVNHPILLGMLKKRPIAIHHYASLLKQLGSTIELTNLYMRLDENEKLAGLKLQQCETELIPGERYNKIRACHTLFASVPELRPDAKQMEDYGRLTDQQRMIEEMEGHGGAVVLRPGTVLFRSMVTTLLYCCRFHRDRPDTNTGSPVALRRQFNISEKQYFQMYLLALCIDEAWESLDQLVTTKGFMGMGKKKKSPIGFERIVKTIARKSPMPPMQILKKYLTEVDDLELRLQLATEVGVYDVGLECLKLLRDRERLRGYINQIPPNKHWDYRKKIDALLANSHIKWK